MAVLVDSDVLIEVSRGRNTPVIDRWQTLSESAEAILVSPIAVAELWRGARPMEHAVLEGLFAALLCVPIDEQVARTAGDFLRKYARSHSVELADAMIAASAAIHEARLRTFNRKHYPMTGLRFF